MDPNPAIPPFISQQETENNEQITGGFATDTSGVCVLGLDRYENVPYDSSSSTSALILNPYFSQQIHSFTQLMTSPMTQL